jgi:hypothetical protein
LVSLPYFVISVLPTFWFLLYHIVLCEQGVQCFLQIVKLLDSLIWNISINHFLRLVTRLNVKLLAKYLDVWAVLWTICQ